MQEDNVKALIAGGGTGGHIYAGIAIAEEIKERWKGAKILFVGAKRGLESKILPSTGIDFELIDSLGIKGKNFKEMVRGIKQIPVSIMDSIKILRTFKPNFAVGVGGYSSGPTIVSAWILGIPSIILEQNLYPGTTNRILGGFAKFIAVNFRDSQRYFPKRKTICVGNPVRKNLLKISREEALKKWDLDINLFTLFVFGGSQGAKCFNDLMPAVCSLLEKAGKKIQIIHQTGESDFERVKKLYEERKLSNVVIKSFITDMGDAYSAADIVISRAGATTLSELCSCAKASLLIPFPYATNNHQEYNALYMQKEGASIMVREREATPERISQHIAELMEDRGRIRKMEENAKKLDRPNAAREIVELCRSLIGQR
ncbi:MAG: undecaprenyldiphospho-muramoylpentapeptide beta-N-acetylglucosaminyltransferase [Candidatus Schekmanbacteria bacterium]|nr:MAG: undecaprenyldiphospho-muramoylpentapeptide beta-N-acetylglucosaminyltransferase [Candidatus Schekmanbacteria bacterium]